MIFHTLTNYCNKDAKILKRVFLFGSIIPAIIYIIWTSSVSAVVYDSNPEFYNKMVEGRVEVGALIEELSSIAQSQYIQLLVWWISILAIITSVLGVGVGLCDSIKSMISPRFENSYLRNVLASILTILPPYIIAICVPNAFIAVLGFAGMILVVIAILLPMYLLKKAKIKKWNYPILNNKLISSLSTIFGIIVIVSELFNMYS